MEKNKEYGFTLIELMISMAIFSVIMAAMYGIYISYSRTSTIQNVSAGVEQSLRVGLELMAQDIRMAGYDPAGAGNAGIEFAGANKIRVTSDRNYNNNIANGPINVTGSIDNSDFERVTYDLSGASLRRILYESPPAVSGSEITQPLIDNVTALNFVYRDTDGIDTAVLSDIVTVDILLRVTEPAGMGGDVTRELTTSVYCRNLDL